MPGMHAVPRLADLTRDLDVERRSIDFAKWLSCLHEAHGVTDAASARFLDRWPTSLSTEVVRRSVLRKAATAPGTTTDAQWAAPLAPISLVEGFVQLARSASLLGRIPGLRSIPFRARLPIETNGGSYAWVGQGAPKPITKLAFDPGVMLDPTKAMGIIVVTDELARLVLPGTETALRDTLIAGLTWFTDSQFLDPTVAAVAGVSPASITNGLTPATAGSDVKASVDALLKAFFAARPGADDAVLVMSAGTRARLVGPDGSGETYAGLPIVVSGRRVRTSSCSIRTACASPMAASRSTSARRRRSRWSTTPPRRRRRRSCSICGRTISRGTASSGSSTGKRSRARSCTW